MVGCIRDTHIKSGPAQNQFTCPQQDLIVSIDKDFREAPEIHDAVLKLVQKEAMVLSQVAGCHRLHSAEERLARWLLMAQDQTQTDDLHFTQVLLANMLGARRATVTEVAGSLQRKGLIQYHRGHVIIADRNRLERVACQCYQVIKDLRGDLYNIS